MAAFAIFAVPMISIHAPPRGATRVVLVSSDADDVFQFTPLREGRPSLRCWLCVSGYFNSRPSARGDPTTRMFLCARRRFQFTPLREGRLVPHGEWEAWLSISIHAPPRGATNTKNILRRKTPYFNSRPSARGDGASDGQRSISAYFNSRPSARGDEHIGAVMRLLYISIHAPPRGATGRVVFLSLVAFHFNSRPSARGDAWTPTACMGISYFNSRPSARGDRLWFFWPAAALYFNSRPSARGDRRWSSTWGRGPSISIHAPPRGATGAPCPERNEHDISIHAPPRGATRGPGRPVTAAKFQFTPLREGRRTLRNACSNFHHFNSRPSARGDASTSGRSGTST